ncbi:MAG: hypothetical protein KA885_02765 [Spirochaetes bacterium]|nr:hypothetical protein [Spirochaetota bacterium]
MLEKVYFKSSIRFAIVLVALFGFSCSSPSVDYETKGNDIDLSNVDSNLISSIEEVKQETAKKRSLFPESYEKSWLIEEIKKDFNFIGVGSQPITEMAENYKNAVTTGIILKLFRRTKEFETLKSEKYKKMSCDIDYNGIKKGDVILSVTRNATLMACGGEDVPHHALLCVADPTSDESKVFITTNGHIKPEVALYPLSFLKQNDDIVIVLRLYKNNSETIDIIVDFAMRQLGKTYNMYFTDKMTTDSFYCTQLIWRAYMEAGINIDSNDNQYYDYGIALAGDIYTSPYLFIVKFSY